MVWYLHLVVCGQEVGVGTERRRQVVNFIHTRTNRVRLKQQHHFTTTCNTFQQSRHRVRLKWWQQQQHFTTCNTLSSSTLQDLMLLVMENNHTGLDARAHGKSPTLSAKFNNLFIEIQINFQSCWVLLFINTHVNQHINQHVVNQHLVNQHLVDQHLVNEHVVNQHRHQTTNFSVSCNNNKRYLTKQLTYTILCTIFTHTLHTHLMN